MQALKLTDVGRPQKSKRGVHELANGGGPTILTAICICQISFLPQILRRISSSVGLKMTKLEKELRVPGIYLMYEPD